MSIIVNNFSQVAAGILGRCVNAPEQRFVQGLTGLPLQTFIDSQNNKADKETRIASVSRTAGKVIAGTLTGVLIRYAGIHVIRHFTKYDIVDKAKGFVREVKPATKWDIFMPRLEFKEKEISTVKFKEFHNNYIKMMGTFFATLTMMYTNFSIDAPLTRYIDRKIKPRVREYFDNKEAKQ